VIQCRVAGHTQQPGGERDLFLLVLADHLDQLGEDVLGDVFGFVVIVYEAVDVAEEIGRVTDIEEVESLSVSLLDPPDCILDELVVRSRLSV
jgi:hypothetical protein